MHEPREADRHQSDQTKRANRRQFSKPERVRRGSVTEFGERAPAYGAPLLPSRLPESATAPRQAPPSPLPLSPIL